MSELPSRTLVQQTTAETGRENRGTPNKQDKCTFESTRLHIKDHGLDKMEMKANQADMEHHPLEYSTTIKTPKHSHVKHS